MFLWYFTFVNSSFIDSLIDSRSEDEYTDQSNTGRETGEDSIKWCEPNINSYYKYNLKLAHININGLRNKPDEVKQILNCKLFDMLFISETKIDNTIWDWT